jgi:hypothetical protein
VPSVYLQPQDYGAYGIWDEQPGRVQQASILLDNAWLRRPEGLIWVADGAGQPCWMQALSPDFSLASVGAIAPGQNVAVQVTGPLLMLQVGDVLVLDRMNTSISEACVIASIAGQLPGALTATLKQVLFSHAENCTMESGLVMSEQKVLAKDRPITFMSRVPLVRVISGTGRYGYGRRGDAGNYNVDDFNLLAALSKFGGPPAWEIWDPANCGIDPATGQVWIPAGVMLAYYSEVKVRYVAGFTYANLPPGVKLACAQLVSAIKMNPVFGAVSAIKTGETSIENFVSSHLSDDVKAMLQPWVVRAFG